MTGVGGPMPTSHRGELRLPMQTSSHGIRAFREKNSILNPKCPYVLLAIGRASREQGVCRIVGVELPASCVGR